MTEEYIRCDIPKKLYDILAEGADLIGCPACKRFVEAFNAHRQSGGWVRLDEHFRIIEAQDILRREGK